MGVGGGKSSRSRCSNPYPNPPFLPLRGLVQAPGFLAAALFVELTLGVEAGEFVGHGLDAPILGKALEQSAARGSVGDEVSGRGVGQGAWLIGQPAEALHERRGFFAEFGDDVLGEGEHARDVPRATEKVVRRFVDDRGDLELGIRRLAFHLDDPRTAQAFEYDVRRPVLEFDVPDDAPDAREGAGRFVVVGREAVLVQLRDREHAAAGEGLLQHLAVTGLEDAQRQQLLREEDAVAQGHDGDDDGGNHAQEGEGNARKGKWAEQGQVSGQGWGRTESNRVERRARGRRMGA